MRTIPAIDLKAGRVVRGVGGNRANYRPLKSPLCPDAKPATLARSLTAQGFREAYLADLDALAGTPPSTGVYHQLLDIGLNLWIDAGVTSPRRAIAIAEFSPQVTVVVGTETLSGLESLGAILDSLSPERVVVSLDLKCGRLMTTVAEWIDRTADQVANEILEAGVRRLLVLDLWHVGQRQGTGTASLCRQIRQKSADLELLAGGGVRSIEDLLVLADSGCDAALVATALHEGAIDSPTV